MFVITEQLDEVFVNGCPTLKENVIQGCFSDIKFQLKAYFESPDILKKTFENIENINNSSNINHFIKVELWQTKLQSHQNKIIFPLFLYFDAFQINDALGSHPKSVCGIYYTIPVVPQHHVAHLNNIFIFGYINSDDMKNFGNHMSLQRLIAILQELADDVIDVFF